MSACSKNDLLYMNPERFMCFKTLVSRHSNKQLPQSTVSWN